jgi:hypothetical protein
MFTLSLAHSLSPSSWHCVCCHVLQESHIKQLVESLGSGAINPLAVMNTDIPTPTVRIVEDYERENKPTFVQRNATPYISYKLPRDMYSIVEYDLDYEDDQWLGRINGEQHLELSEQHFEYMMDRFEKEQASQVCISLSLSLSLSLTISHTQSLTISL